MSDFLGTVETKFFAAAGVTAPATPSNADDSTERAALAAAITGGDPATIARAAKAVAFKDAEELAQQVLVNREMNLYLRQAIVGLTSGGGNGLQLSPAMLQAIAPAREDEVKAGSSGYVGEAASGVWSGYLTALEGDSTAQLA